MKKRVGLIGLGAIGNGMAANLLKHHFFLTAYDIRPEAIRHQVSRGATGAVSPREVGERSDVVICVVLNFEQIESAVLGPEGALAGMQPGSLLVLSSTIAPSDARKLSAIALKQQVTVIDAPLSGGKAGAEAGTLTFMVGGPKQAFEEVKPVLEAIGKHIAHINEDVGSGLVVKATNQVVAHVTMVAIAEAMVFGARAGVDPVTIFETLSHCTANSQIWRDRVPAILSRDFSTRGSLDIQVKDLAICLGMGKEMQLPMFLSSAAQQVYLMGQADGYGQEDLAAVVKIYEHYAGMEVAGNVDDQHPVAPTIAATA